MTMPRERRAGSIAFPTGMWVVSSGKLSIYYLTAVIESRGTYANKFVSFIRTHISLASLNEGGWGTRSVGDFSPLHSF